MSTLRQWFAICFVAVYLVACSSDNNNNTPPPTSKPTANAGVDQTVKPGDNVQLDGAQSSAGNSSRVLTAYQWTQTSGTPTVTINNADKAVADFVAPTVSVATNLGFRLTVTDSQGEQASDTVTISIVPTVNQAPVANAGPDATKVSGSTVSLDGSQSNDPDPNDGIVSYSWVQSAGTPTVTLTGTDSATPSFTAPNVSASTDLTFELTVTDNFGLTASDTVIITVIPATSDQAPMANAGPDATVAAGDTVTLDGSQSSDPDPNDGIASYSWVQSAGSPTVTLTGADTAKPTFTAPSVSANSDLTFALTVTDNFGLTATDTVVITVTPANQPPMANAGLDFQATAGQSVTLNGSASSDPNDSIATYSWVQSAGTPTVTLTGADTATPSFTAPNVSVNTDLTFQLTVTDTFGAQNSDSIVVTIIPPSQTTSAYLPIASEDAPNSLTYKIDVINNNDPGAGPINIETAGATQMTNFTQFDFDATNNVISNGRAAYLLYYKNSHFWRLPLITNTTPQPEQVTSNSFVLCGDINASNQALDPLQTSIVFSDGGVDSDCATVGDNKIYVIQLGYSATDSALDATKLFVDAQFVAIEDNGFFAATGNSIYFYSKDLQTSTNLNIPVTDPASVQFSDASDRYMLAAVDGELISIDGTAAFSASVWSMGAAGLPDQLDCDSADCYFVATKTNGSNSVYKFPIDGSSIATELTATNSMLPIFSLRHTSNYLFYVNVSFMAQQSTLYRFPKVANASDTPLVVDSGTSFFPLIFANPNGIFYEFQSVSNMQLTSSAVFTDEAMSAKQVFANARIAGIEIDSLSLNDGSTLGKALFAVGTPDVINSLAGATIQAVSLADGSQLPNIGVIPANSQISQMFLSGLPFYGANRYYAQAYLPDTQGGVQSDIYLIEPNATTIFNNITNTAQQSELFLPSIF